MKRIIIPSLLLLLAIGVFYVFFINSGVIDVFFNDSKKVEPRIKIENCSSAIVSFDLDSIKYWTDTDGGTSVRELKHAKFISDTTDPDYVRSLLPGINKSIVWVRIVLSNKSNKDQLVTLHTGNIEFARLYYAESKVDSLGGYLRGPFKVPHIDFLLKASAKDQKVYLAIENFFVPPGEIRCHIGLKTAIQKKREEFIGTYGWWFCFQIGFFSVSTILILSNCIHWFFAISRREYGYYASYVAIFMLLFAALTVETWFRSFSVKSGYTFTILLCKTLFIVYSFAYVKFFDKFLNLRTEEPIALRLDLIHFIQGVVVLVDVFVLFIVDIPASMKLNLLALMGSILNLTVIGLNIHLFQTKSYKKFKELWILNVSAVSMNFVAVPIAVVEIAAKTSYLGPVGLMSMQIFSMLESVAFIVATGQKTVRLNQQNENLLAAELRFFDDIMGDIHDMLGNAVAKIIRKVELLEAALKNKKWELIANLKREMLDNSRKLRYSYRLLLELYNTKNNLNLGFVFDMIRQFCIDISENSPQFKLNIDVPYSSNFPITLQQRKHLILFAQEVLNNCFKYAFPPNDENTVLNIDIIFNWDEKKQTYLFTIKDDGVGFDVDEKANSSIGLGSMAYRAKVLSAVVKIESSPGQGTTITLRGRLSA